MAQTSAVSTAGTYYVTSSTLLFANVSDEAFCYQTTANTAPITSNFGGNSSAGGYVQASNTADISISAGDSFELWCYDSADNGYVYGGTLTATLINTDNPSAKGRSKALAPPGVH